ncbi:hypothetical protein [Roseinatronobacter alkalisoli]|uniref:Uncharacterized protein n=1 Tax=Roseinatronobacter alkalisoli TaxID=3028235 RepID=A0ABT5T5A0_9RHOB|nr:hypothetical protein [Roseinatronobacter sp. HJB301]MDD7970161.1 hypothetical protein [Roseinatronobacter sp. HJB301]
MTQNDRVKRLQAMAQLIRDRDLAHLQKLANARNETRARAEKLSRPVPLTDDPALFAARQLHAKWALDQRLRLNRTLARQTAHMLEQRAKAARSLGRAEALSQLCARKAD